MEEMKTIDREEREMRDDNLRKRRPNFVFLFFFVLFLYIYPLIFIIKNYKFIKSCFHHWDDVIIPFYI